MNLYLYIKYIHILCAIISISGFILRGIWLVIESPLLKHALVKKLPHFVDATLLLTALVMVFMSRQYPFVLDWLTVKVVVLIIYILLGMVALRWGRTRTVRIAAWLAAVICFLFIVSVALTRQASGVLSLI